MGTDGIWDAENERGERFGKDRFESLIRDHVQESAQKRVGAVMAALHQFCQTSTLEDVLVVRRTGYIQPA